MDTKVGLQVFDQVSDLGEGTTSRRRGYEMIDGEASRSMPIRIARRNPYRGASESPRDGSPSNVREETGEASYLDGY
jgi:hypothetical protein